MTDQSHRSSTSVLLVRHGQTTWNREGRIQGWADAGLTDRGRRQAETTGADLADTFQVDRLVVSDLQRTRETADWLRHGGLATRPDYSALWRERDFGEFQGLTREEIATRLSGYEPDGSLLAVPDVPGGESLAAGRERVTTAWERLVASATPSETTVVVTHGGPIRVVLAHLTGRELPALARECSPSNCGITIVDLDGIDGVTVRSTDDTTHLDGIDSSH